MDRTMIRNSFWTVEERPAIAYNDFNEYIVKDKSGNVIAKIPNQRSIADRIVNSHNALLLDILAAE